MLGTARLQGPEDITLERVLRNHSTPAPIVEAAEGLVPLGVSAIGYACTSGSYVRSIQGAAEISEGISTATGLPAVTTSGAMAKGLKYLGLRRIAVLSPHLDDLNERLDRFLVESGFEVAAMRGLNVRQNIEGIPPSEIRDAIVYELDTHAADGVFVSCTSMRTAGIIDDMESSIGKPVVTANQATVWELLGQAGLGVSGPGMLFSEIKPADHGIPVGGGKA